MSRHTNIKLIPGNDALVFSKAADTSLEKLVISAFVLMGRVAMKRYHGRISESWFTDSVFKRVYRILDEMYSEGLDIEIAILIERLQKLPNWSELDGDDRLSLAIDNGIKLDNVDNYVNLLAEKYRLRKMQNVIMGIWQSINHDVTRQVESYDTTIKLAASAVAKLRAISNEGVITSAVPVGEVALERMKHRETVARLQQRYTGVPSGISQLDEMTLGFQPSDLIIVAGRPSMGKTGCGLSLAMAAQEYTGKRVYIESVEMSKEAITDRILSIKTGIPLTKLRAPAHLNENENRALAEATQWLLDSGTIVIQDVPMSLDEMIMNWYRAADEGDLGMVVLDYVQLVGGREEATFGNDLRKAVGSVANKTKAALKELKVPGILLSQVKREVETRPDKRPMMSDLSEAGMLENAADLIVMLYRDWVYNPGAENADPTKIELIVAKQRNGPIGTAVCGFNPKTASLFNPPSKVEQRRLEEINTLLHGKR